MSLKYVKKLKNEYYTRADIDALDCEYNIILSGRDIGKSYSIAAGEKPHELVEGYLIRAFEKKSCVLAYIRRLEKETKGYSVEEDFHDKFKMIEKVSRGQFDGVSVWQGRLYFSKIQENGSCKRAPWFFGKIISMQCANQFKSKQYPDIEYVVYEEFITDDLYIRDEPTKLLNLVSTLARDRRVHVYLLGNTVSRACPYIEEWGLTGVMQQAENTIDTYVKINEDGSETRIAVEIAPNRQKDVKRSMFFGKARESITGSKWQTKEYPHLKGKISDYNELYKVMLSYPTLTFYIMLLCDRNGVLFDYVYPTDGRRNMSTIKGRKVTSKPLLTFTETNCLGMNDAEKIIVELFTANKVVYAHDLCGTDIEQQEALYHLIR